MSRNEILSWTSLATSTSVAVFYTLIVIGWPESFSNISSGLTKLFFNVFWVAVLIEIIVELTERKGNANIDERDLLIEAKGHKVGYRILTITVMIALVQLFLNSLFGNYIENFPVFTSASFIIHFLFLGLFLASASKRMVMIYHYRKGL